MRCDLRHSLGRPTLAARPPLPPTSHIKTLSALVSCHVTCRSPVFSYISKQTCDPVLNETSSLFLIKKSLPLFLPLSASIWTVSVSVNSSSIFNKFHFNPQVFLLWSGFLSTLVIPLQLCFCCSDIPLSPPPSRLPLSFFLPLSLQREITAPQPDRPLAALNQAPSLTPDVSH